MKDYTKQEVYNIVSEKLGIKSNSTKVLDKYYNWNGNKLSEQSDETKQMLDKFIKEYDN